jgi:hypothetical protein
MEEWLFKKYTTFTQDIEKCPSEVCDYVFTMEKCNNWLGGGFSYIYNGNNNKNAQN